ncbi:MAG: 16S rRNA (guanine(966)-N(2))-methyltransferase RsmD [Deltaproteobacteria bacterium]
MRIIAGIYKGRRFNPPINNSFTRPTMDMAKEGLFNILSNKYDFEDISVLDLFGGTGSISFEFLSRGCRNVTFVEMNSSLIRFVGEVSNLLRTQEHMKIIRDDALKFLKKTEFRYDLIFADPPYNYLHYKEMHQVIYNRELILNEGSLIFEHDKSQDFYESEYFDEIRIYGTNRFSFFTH